MIKVVNVISDTNIGGAGKCILIFLKNFNRKKFSVTVALPKNSLLKDEIEKLDIRAVEIDGIGDKSLSLKGTINLYKYFRKEQPDIIHTHASMSAKLAGRMADSIPIVYTRHTVFPPRPYMTTLVGRKINRLINHSFSDQIIAVAEAAKKNLTDTGIADDKVLVIQNGVDYVKSLNDDQRLEIRKKYGIGEKDFVIAIAARLNIYKGHKYIIKAIKLALEKESNIKLLIAGIGEEEISLKEQVKELKIEDNVIFTGFIDDISGIMNLMDIGINASFDTEATSLALLEGMSLGKPAIVTITGGNPDVIADGENGLLVPVKDPEKLANAILKLARDRDLMDYMQKKSKEIFKKKFTSEIVTRKIETLYEELILRKRGTNYVNK